MAVRNAGYSKQGKEPKHVHAVKGGAECEYWLLRDRFDIIEKFEHHSTPRLRREIRQVIFERFDPIIAAWRSRRVHFTR